MPMLVGATLLLSTQRVTAQCTLEPLAPFAPIPTFDLPIDASPSPSTADLNCNIVSAFFSSDCGFCPLGGFVNFYTAASGGAAVTSESFSCPSVGPAYIDRWVTVTGLIPGSAESPRRQIKIRIVDNTAPTVTMPAGSPFARFTNTGCGYTIAGAEFNPTSVVDNCPSPTSEYSIDGGAWVTAATLAGVVLNGVGSHTIVWRITDASLSNQTLSSTITVNITDNVLPMITCPGVAARNTDANLCTYTIAGVEFNPTVSDNCSAVNTTYSLTGATTLASPLAPNSIRSLNGIVLAKGVTNITWTVTDASGNMAMCGPFAVTVTDMQTPVIVATAPSGSFNATPANAAALTIGTATASPAAPLCDGQYKWNHPTVTDNCMPLVFPAPAMLTMQLSGATVVPAASVAPGGGSITQLFNLGLTTVTYLATDNNGKTSSSTFTVTVVDNVSPVLSFGFKGTLDQTETSPSPNIYVQPVDPGTCGGTITVERPSDAIFSAPPDFSCFPFPCSNYSFSDCGAVTGPIQGIAVINGMPNPTFLNSAPALNTLDPVNRFMTLTFPVGRTEIPYTFTDNMGNDTTVFIIVEIKESEFPAANCVGSITLALGATGTVSLDPLTLNNGSSDNCGSVVFSLDQLAPYDSTEFDCSEIGMRTAKLYVEDYSGNVSTCLATVNIVDNTPPQVVCPLPITVNTYFDPMTMIGVCTAPGTAAMNLLPGTINALNPGQWADNCAGTTIGWAVTGASTGSGVVSGMSPVLISTHTFNKGLNNVVYTLDDPSNPAVTCNFAVTVVDNQAPVAMNCPPNITVDANIAPGCSYKKPNSATCIVDANIPANQWCGTVNFTDNCDVASMVSNPGSLTQTYSLGTNPIVITKTDAAGNVGTCAFTITVVDQTAPTAICKNVVVSLDAAGNGTAYAQNNDMIASNDVNDASFDNCYLDLIYSISVNGGAFVASKNFVCADIGAMFSVVLKVAEDGGSKSSISTPCTITVEDKVVPTCMAQNITLQLGAAIPGMVTATASSLNNGSSDNCVGPFSYAMSTSAMGTFTPTLAFDCTPLGVNAVFLQVTDAHGNTSLPCAATVTIQDVTNPVVVSTPGNTTVSCDVVGGIFSNTAAITAYLTPLADATFSDNCTVMSITETFGVTPGSCPNNYTINRVWEATDGAGHTVQAIQNIIVQDVTKPTIALPANVTLNLSNFMTCTPSVAYSATLSDNCSLPALLATNTTWVIDYPGVLPANTTGTGVTATPAPGYLTGVNVITFTTTDACGNVQVNSMTVTVLDNVAPVFSSYYVPTTLSSYCGHAPFVFTNTPSTCGYTFNWVRPWNGDITDCNTTTFGPESIVAVTPTGVQTLTANFPWDPTNPLTEFVPISINLPVGTTTFTYSSSDATPNVKTCVFTVQVTDTQAPALTCPANLTLNTICPTSAVTDYTNLVNVTDNCLSSVVVTQSKIGVLLGNVAGIGYLPGPPSPPTDGSSFQIVFTATDGTNAATPCITTITLNDSDAPIPTAALLPIVSDCGYAIVSAPTAFPNCGLVPLIYGTPGGVSATPFEVVSLNVLKYKVTGTGNFFITWSYNDGNGNVTTQLQQLTINPDTMPPIAKCKTTLTTITLGAAFPATASITAQMIDRDNGSFSVNGSHDPDFCTLPTPPATVTTSAVTLALSQGLYTCADLNKTTVTLTATDAAGNTASCTASIKVVDVNAPVYQNLPMLPLAPLMVECGNPIPAGANFIAIDNCADTIIVSPIDVPVSNPNICGLLASKSFVRTWSVTDNNTPPVTITQDIFVIDTKAPIWKAVAPTTMMVSTPTVTTVCQAAVTLQVLNTWVVDSCVGFGNLTFQNSIVGPGMTYSAGCGPTNACASGVYKVGTHTVTFTATDPCGNSSQHTVTVVVKDATPPTAVCINGISIALNPNGQAIVTPVLLNNNSYDNCSPNVPLTFQVQELEITNGDTIGNPANQIVFDCDQANNDTEYPVILIVTDGGGNVSICETKVVVQDNVTPTITCPANVTIDCEDDLDPYVNLDLGIAGAVDNCPNNVDTTYTDAPLTVVSYTCPSVIRTWRAEDLAGNAATCTQLLKIEDTEDPEFDNPLPQNDTISCFEDDVLPVVTARDNCTPTDSIVINFTQVKTDSVGVCGKYEYKVTRSWTAFDKCGNSATHVQVLVVIDTLAPTFFLPPNREINQFSANALPTTNCTVPIVYNLGAQGVFNECAPLTECTINYIHFEPQPLNPITPNVLDISGNYPVGTTKVIFSVTDPCGNEGVDTLTINIVDNSLPIAICNNNVVISLGSNGNASIDATDIDLNSNDNCGIDTMFLSQYDFTCADLGFQPDTMTVIDVYGNANFCVVNVQVTLGASTGFTLSTTGTPETYFGAGNGAAATVAGGGTGSFTYTWSTTETIAAIDGLDAGVYTVTVVDTNTGCLSIDTAIVAAGPKVTVTVGTATGCQGATISVPVTVDNFISVSGFSFGLTLGNGLVGAITGFSNVNPALVGLVPGVNTVFWTHPTLLPTTLPNGTVLFNVDILLSNAALGTTSTIVTTVNNPALFLQDGLNQAPMVNFNAGTATINCVVNDLELIGDVFTWKAPVKPVPGVTITLAGTSPGTDVTTLPNADYGFMVSAGANSVTSAAKASLVKNNKINVGDMLGIQAHAALQASFTNPFQWVAADINGDARVNLVDYALVQAYVLGSSAHFPGAQQPLDWKFVPKSHLFAILPPGNPAPPALNPLNNPVPPSTIVHNNISASFLDDDFVAVLMGDVNGDVAPSLTGNNGAEFQSSDVLKFRLDDRAVQAGEIITVPFKALDFTNTQAYQLTIAFDPEVFELQDIQPGVLPGLSQGNFGTDNLADGYLSTLWVGGKPTSFNDNETLFSLTFKAIESVPTLSNVLHSSADITDALAIDEAGNVIPVDFEFVTSVATGEVTSKVFALYQNQPNPFSAETNISFRLPEAGRATLRVFSSEGRLVKMVVGEFAEGINAIKFRKDEFGSNGVFYYELETPKHSDRKKMILID